MLMLTNEEKIKFESLCREISAQELDGNGIGTLSEKRMHKTLKKYVCPNEDCHEIRVRADGSACRSSGRAESGKGGYIADVCDGERIFEIQTGSFYPMKAKIEFYLNTTEFEVTIVHPLIAEKWSLWIDPKSGDITPRRRSPKKERLSDLLPELYWLSDLLDSDRLSFVIPVLEAEEYRLLDGWSRDRKKGSNRYERIPIGLIDIMSFKGRELVRAAFPEGMPEEFTASDISKAIRLKGRRLYSSIKVLVDSGVIERGEKVGRSYVYRRTKV